MKKLLSALLLLCMLALTLASCGGGKKETTPETTPPTTTPPVTSTMDPEVSEWESIATEVKEISESLRSFKFELSTLVEESNSVKCKEYMQGPDSLEKATANIDKLVYNRNKAATDALGVKISYGYGNYAWGAAAAKIQEQTNDATNPDASDMFAYSMYDLVMSCFNSSFRDLASIQGSYFDWEAEGWHPEVMSDMSFGRDKIYVMASDYFVELYRNLVILPFNMTMLDGAVAELGTILLPAGQSLRDGETLSDYLFQLVLEGKWTWDVMIAMCEKIYIDANGDGKEDVGDRMGIYMDYNGGVMAAACLYSTKIQCLSDGIGQTGELAGKLVPTYPATGDAINQVFQAVGKVINAKGSYVFTNPPDTSLTWFSQGLGLTTGPATIAEIEHESIQTMEDVFSLVPVPLITEGTTSDYNTYVSNSATLGAFNINSTKYLAMSAYIQHVTENSEEIKDEYLQTVMKFKNVDFNLGTSEMLDLVYANIQSVREMILDNVLRARKKDTIFNPAGLGDVRWHGLIKSGAYAMATGSVNGGAFLDKYEQIKGAKQKAMNELMIEWYNLPGGPASS